MKKIARRFARAGLLATITGVAAAALVVPGTASAATAGPAVTITAAYGSQASSSGTPSIAVGNTFDLVYTIKNASTTVEETNIGFSDQLPGGIVLDDNPGETPKSCAVGDANTGVSPNTAGSATITVAGVSVLPSTSCTISFAVVASTPLAANATADSISGATFTPSTGGSALAAGVTDAYVSGSTTALGINVFANPTVVFGITGTPTYGYGQVVDLGFAGTPAVGDSLSSVTGSDDQGNVFISGSAINTDVPGEHQITALVSTNAGGGASAVFTYNVNSPNLTAVKTTKTGQVEFDVKYLQAGSVAAEVLDGKTVFGKVTKNVSVGKTTEITVTPTAAGKKIVAAYNKPAPKPKHGKAKKAKAKPGFKVKLSVLYTATNWSYAGNQPTIVKSGITVK